TSRMEEEVFSELEFDPPVTYATTGGPIGQIGTMRWNDAIVSKNKKQLVISYERMTSIWDINTGRNSLLDGFYPIGFSHDDTVLGLIKEVEVPGNNDPQQFSYPTTQYALFLYEIGGRMQTFMTFGNLSAAFPIGGWPISASFSPNQNQITIGYSNGKIATWDFAGKLVQEFGSNSANELIQCEVDQGEEAIINFYFKVDNTDITQSSSEENCDTLNIRFSLETGVINADLAKSIPPASFRSYSNDFFSESSGVQISSPLQAGLDGRYAAPSVNTHDGIVTITRAGEELANFYEGYGITDIGLVNEQYLILSKDSKPPAVLDYKKLLNLAQNPANVVKRDLFGMATVNILKDDLRSQFLVHETTPLPNYSEQLDWSDEMGLVLIKPYDTWDQIDKLGVNQYQEVIHTNLLAYSPSQQRTLEFKDVHDLKILGAQFFGKGQFAISWSRDRSCKIWDVNTGNKLFTLFWLNDQDWIALAPNGLFDASAGVMDLLYYTTNQEIIELEQLKARYYEPGLIQKLLGYSEERIRPVDGLNNLLLFPEMVNPKIESDLLTFQLKARNGGIGRASIAINGKEIVEEVNPESEEGKNDRNTDIQFDLRPYQSYLLKGASQKNTVTVHTYNAEGWLKSPAYSFDYEPSVRTRGSGSNTANDEPEYADPKLYVISVGTSDYTGDKLDLKYADQDATTMAKAMSSVGTTLFASSLEVFCFTTANKENTGLENTSVNWQFAEKKNIRRTFKKIQGEAKAEDVILVYLSGHGVAYGTGDIPQFHYLTQGIADENLSDAEIRKAYTISSNELTRWLNKIPALKQVLIIDACNSGQIVENITGGTKNLNSSQIRAIDRMKDRTGMFVLSGSAADKVSYEASEYGQGLLTYALLQGMLGVATRKTADGDYVDVMKLFQYARDEVPRLAQSINGIQTPMMGFPKQGASFDIGIVNDNVNIPIGNKKPVLVRSNFMNKITYLDDANLASALETEFREETEKGKNADFIYVDVYDYPAAYSLNGLYEKDLEGNIIVKVKLYKDSKDPVDLTIRQT
ncbi:MAG: caspase family protein, partial [Bacteroidota bacterium]